MRFALAVIISAIAQLLFFLRFAASGDSATGYLAFLYIVLAAIGAGWFAARRGALAGALAVIVAAVLDAVVVLFGPAGQGMPPFEIVASVLTFVVAFWPYVVIGAIGGALGGVIRVRVVGVR